MVFDECGGKSVFSIPSNVSLIKDLSLIKDRSHIDTSKRAISRLLLRSTSTTIQLETITGDDTLIVGCGST